MEIEKQLIQLRLQEEQTMQRFLNTGSDTEARESCMIELGSGEKWTEDSLHWKYWSYYTLNSAFIVCPKCLLASKQQRTI